MSRILLFVQTGDTRATCAWWSNDGERPPVTPSGQLYALRFKLGSAADAVACGQHPADRWWLVECENAEAGRSLIAESLWDHDTPDNHWVARCLQTTALAHGRIVASGSRPAAVLTGGDK